MSATKPNRASESTFELARNELFNHILNCGVLDAAEDDQREWFDDTMDYLADRYENLSNRELLELRRLGEQYCRPVINRAESEAAADSETVGASP